MKIFKGIRKTAVAVILLVSVISSSLALASCGNSRPKTEVPENMKSEERKKTRENISDEDRAAYTAKLDEYMQYLNGDYSVIEDLYPADYWEVIGSTPEEIVEALKASAESNRAASVQKYGEGYKATYEIESEKNYELLLESLKSSLKENFNIAPERISKAYNLYVTITISGPKNKSSDSFYIMPTNIDGNWYLVNERGDFN